MQTEFDRDAAIDSRAAQPPGFDVPPVPTAADWLLWCQRKRLIELAPLAPVPHLRAFVTIMDALSVQPEFRAAAQAVALTFRRERRAAAIAFLKQQIGTTDPSEWGLPPAALKQLERLLSGRAAPAPGPGVPSFDAADAMAALRHAHGAARVEGSKKDVLALRDLHSELSRLEAEQSADVDADTQAMRARKAAIVAAQQAAPQPEAAPEDDGKSEYAASRKRRQDLRDATVLTA